MRSRPSPEQVARNRALIDYLMAINGYKYFVTLSKAINSPHRVVNEIRSGILAVSDTTLIRIHENLGVPFSKLREYVPDTDVRPAPKPQPKPQPKPPAVRAKAKNRSPAKPIQQAIVRSGTVTRHYCL